MNSLKMSTLQKLCGCLSNLGSRQLSILSSKINVPHCRRIIDGTSPSSATLGTSLVSRCMASLSGMRRSGPIKKYVKPLAPMLEGCSQKRGIVLKVIVKKPKKPNSANRKCVRIRMTNGIEATAYVPGEGHNLQEHSIVLVQGGRLQDCPGVKLVCVRGKYDLAHVKKKT